MRSGNYLKCKLILMDICQERLWEEEDEIILFFKLRFVEVIMLVWLSTIHGWQGGALPSKNRLWQMVLVPPVASTQLTPVARVHLGVGEGVPGHRRRCVRTSAKVFLNTGTVRQDISKGVLEHWHNAPGLHQRLTKHWTVVNCWAVPGQWLAGSHLAKEKLRMCHNQRWLCSWEEIVNHVRVTKCHGLDICLSCYSWIYSSQHKITFALQ